MKSNYIILICVLLLMACNENPKPQPYTVDDNGVEESYDMNNADSVSEEFLQKATEEEPAYDRPKTTSPSPDRYKRKTDSKKQGYDNMRCFDPASEDDMDDNGMSRYMENNDEEGWD